MADFNLSAEVSMDVDPLKAAKTSVENNLKAINKSLRNQRKEMKQNEVSAESLAKQETDLGRAIKLQEGLISQRNDELKAQQLQMKKSNKVTDEQKVKLQKLSGAYEQSKNQLDKYENELKQTQAQQKLLGRSTDTVKNSLGQLRNEAKLTEMRFKQSEKSVSGYKNRLTELSHTMQKQKAHTDLLKGNLRELERAQQGNSREAKSLRNDIIKEAIAFQVLQGRIDETTDELKEYQRQQRLMGTATNAWVGARQQMDRIATTLRSLGELTQGVVGGVMTTHFSALVPILGSVVSLGAGLGGMLTAAAGGAIGMGGAFGIAGIAVKAFAGQATYALKMLEDGQLKVTKEVTAYKGALDGLKTSWEGLIAQNQAAIFNTMTNGINTAKYALTTLNPFLTKTASQIETASGKMLNWAKTSSVAKRSFDILNTQGPKIFQHLLNATQSFVNGSAALFNKLSPLYGWAARGFADMAKSFDDWANSVEGSKAINGFIEYTKANLPIVGNIFGNIFKGIISLFQAFSGHSHNVLLGIQDVTKGFAEWSEGLKKSDGFQQFVQYLETNGPKVWSLIKNITGTLWGLVKGMAPVGAAVLSMSNAFFRWTNTMTNAHPILGKILGILTAVGGVALLAAKPILLLRGALLGATGATKLLGNAGAIAAIKTKIAAAAMVLWTGASKAAALATRGLGLAIRFMSGPIGWVITAIGLLVAGIVHLWKTNETFRNIVIGIWNSIKNAAVASFGFIKVFVVGTFNFVKNNSIKIWQSFKNILLTIIRTWVAGVRNNIMIIRTVTTTVFNFIKSWSIKIWTSLKNGVLSIIRGLTNGTRNLFNILKSGIVKIISTLRNWLITAWTFIKNKIIGIVKSYVNTVRNNFNFLKNGIVKIISNLRNWLITAWNFIKNKTVSIVRNLWSGMKNIFNVLSKGTRSIFNSVKNFLVNLWLSVKNRVINLATSLWNGMKARWNSLSKGTRNIYNSIKNFLINLWLKTKNKVVGFAKNLLDGVKDKWSSLLSSTKKIMNSVANFTSDKWQKIKDKIVGFATTIKDKVTGAFGKMRDTLEGIIDKIKGFISDMVDKVKGGLNKLIDGVNWVGGKLGMDKLPKIKLHTGTEHTNTTTNVVKNGKIARDTFATVGDKGKGNGPNGFRHEAIRYPNGKMAITPNKDTTTFLPQGSSVMNGAQTHAMLSANNPTFSKGTLPRFASGTGGMFDILGNGKKPKKKKHDNHNDAVSEKLGEMWGGTKKASGAIVEGGKKAVSATLGAAAKGKDWLKDKVGDVMDWIEKPGKLLNKILDGFGVNMEGFGIPKAASLPFDMMKGMFGKLKKAATDTFKKWMEEQGGDGGYIKYLDNITTPYSPNGPPPGYAFSWPHPGIDLPYINEPVHSTISGKAYTKEMPGGFGHYIQVKGGALEAFYGHLSKWLVKNGQSVKPGTKLGISGNTGASTGPHLHYEMHKNGKPIDPVKWLKSHNGGGGKKAAAKWKPEIKKALKANGLPTSSAYVNAWVRQVDSESGGNAGAVQNGYTDVNTGGNEARGLAQVIPPTFKAYKLKGHGNIMNGLDNLMAAINYAKSKYGKSGMLGVIGHGHGYATGTNNARRGFNQVFEEGGEIMQMRGGETVIPNDVSIQAFKQIATSDIFSRTQSAVYDAISQYADQLREKQQVATREQQELQRLARDNADIKEQNSILKESLNTMKAILGELTNTKVVNQEIRDKNYFPSSREMTKMNNENMALNSATQLMR
ncbi:peptidoglycan DD-metalloendopeptidase family protein [Staphylococcus saprophyticus]|uniref:peptidoglycan DD-metalloendopeptidase family protein n=1 Tax=Staphylococcus saprophyticus TaxID=29385 RepID=UPI0011A718EC|nr:peptidoglycan DD-metalloendopeptidase family protein [Staphylococcus saprophyticus]